MKTMKIWQFIVALQLFLGVGLGLQAQSLAQQGASVNELVPDGWQHKEAQGDLNKDGLPDLVVVATPDYVENLKTRDDGYVYNFNQPILAIYFGTAQGQLQLWRQYDDVIPADESENCSHEVNVEITGQGALRIAISLFCSAGSYGTSVDTYTYRYQNSDFFLIGMDNEEMRRNTGENTVVSENYLTWKRQVKTSNVFDEHIPSTEKWSRIPKKPLEKLGTGL